jgi:hypothetical protein
MHVGSPQSPGVGVTHYGIENTADCLPPDVNRNHPFGVVVVWSARHFRVFEVQSDSAISVFNARNHRLLTKLSRGTYDTR